MLQKLVRINMMKLKEKVKHISWKFRVTNTKTKKLSVLDYSTNFNDT